MIRDPGWGDPGFLQSALLLSLTYSGHLGFVSVLLVLFCFDGRCSSWHTRCHHNQYPKASSHSFMAWVRFCWFLCLVCCFVFFVFLVCCVFAFCFVFLLMRPWNTHCTMYRSAIAFFSTRLHRRTCMRFTNSFTGKYKLGERPGESHEGVGRKKSSAILCADDT